MARSDILSCDRRLTSSEPQIEVSKHVPEAQTAGSGLLRRSRYYLVALAVVPFLLALIAYFTSEQHINSVENTLRTDRFTLDLQKLLSAVGDAETGQRGYLLTGSEIYLTPYLRAKSEIQHRLAEVATAGRQAGVTSARNEELREAVRNKMSELELTIKLYDSGGARAALEEVRTNRGQQAMAAIRRLIGGLMDEQNATFQRRYAQQKQNQRYVTLSLAMGVGLASVLVVLAFRIGSLYAEERDQVELEIRELNEELESRVQARTAELETRTMESEMRAAELRRSNADLAQFASIASHDLQEPLRMVASYMGMLSRKYGGSLDETALTYIRFAIGGATRMQALINDLLAYSKAGTQALTKERVGFECVVKEAIQNLQIAIEESSAAVRYGSLPVVNVDQVKMTQVVQNLVGNAIKFRKPDVRPEIEISTKRDGLEWVFSVADNGIGFERKYNDRIFQVFQRLHGVGSYPGNGIGLAICRRIVEHHGGRLWAEAEPDLGSTFFFTLPYVKEPS